MEFRIAPVYLVVAGVISLAVGGLFLLLGISGAVVVAREWPGSVLKPAVATGMFILFGLLAFVNGLFAVIKRHEARLILADDTLYIGPYYTAIPYRDITGVSRGTDGEVLLKRAGRFLDYKLPGFFASEAEVTRFIEELTRRIGGSTSTRSAS